MNADSQLIVAVIVYGVTPLLVLAAGYLGWKRIRPRCRRYGIDPYHNRACERKKFWGYE